LYRASVTEKPVLWVGSSRADLRALPEAARRALGFDLRRVQTGRQPRDWKPMTAIGPGVVEIRVRDASGAYRLLYVAKFAEAVYVLHAFQKKTQRTSPLDVAVAATRYQSLRRARKEAFP
jgi:phage-related protein